MAKAEAGSSKSKSSNIAGEKARDAILDKAIEMFAAHGYAGVSTRELTAQAGVNQAAIYYHFGTKREVYIEAVLRCFNEVTSQRIKRLGAISEEEMTLENVLQSFIEPHIRFVTKRAGIHYLRIFLTFSSAPEDILKEIYAEHFGPVRKLFIGKIAVIEPDVAEDDLHRSFGMISNMIVASLFDHGYAATRKRSAHSVNIPKFVDMLVRFSASGIRSLRGRSS